MTEYYSLDLETSGLDRSVHVPIQIGIVQWTRDPNQRWETFKSYISGWEFHSEFAMPNRAICPQCRRLEPEYAAWSQAAEAVHGISQETLRDAPPAAEVSAQVLRWLDEVSEVPWDRRKLLGFQIGRFDIAMLQDHMPSIPPAFHYRPVELNSIISAADEAGLCSFDQVKVALKTNDSHDALEDAWEAAEAWDVLTNWLADKDRPYQVPSYPY